MSSVARGERGSASVLALGVVLGLVAVLLSGLLLVAVLVAGQRARSAADLAALAGAGAVVDGAGQDGACHEAAAVATANGVRLTECSLMAGAGVWPDVRVTAECDVSGTSWTTAAVAVAGGRTAQDAAEGP